jgi:hypothetical protein
MKIASRFQERIQEIGLARVAGALALAFVAAWGTVAMIMAGMKFIFGPL